MNALTFTPYSALAGGALIGTAVVLLWWLIGRVAGVSGVAGGLWFGQRGDRAWRIAFIAGLVLGAAAWAAFRAWNGTPLSAPRTGFPVALLVLAGLLVGYGTTLGQGCTSGHGVCGVARGSRRSLAATVTFLAVAVATTFVVRQVLHAA